MEAIMVEPELPPQSAKIALVLVAILGVAGLVGVPLYVSHIDSGASSQASTPAPADNAKQP